MSCSFDFFCVFGAAEKSHWAEKNTEKVDGNCTGFSAEFFGSQSVHTAQELFIKSLKLGAQVLMEIKSNV